MRRRSVGGALRAAAGLTRPTAALALLLCLLGCRLDAEDWPAVKAGIHARYPDVPSLTPTQLAAWMARSDTVQPVLLDVREPEEYAVSHLAGARRALDIDAALQILDSAPADTPVVAYCSVGYRSAGLTEQLRRHGFTGAVNLEGSAFQWANEDRPLWRGVERVAVVHPYGRPWSALLDSARRADPALIDSLSLAADSLTTPSTP